MTLDDFTTIAWRDFLLWAWRAPELRTQFTATTGLDLAAITVPSGATIDATLAAAATTHESVAARFIEWATREHWGLEHAPAAYQQTIAKRGATS